MKNKMSSRAKIILVGSTLAIIVGIITILFSSNTSSVKIVKDDKKVEVKSQDCVLGFEGRVEEKN